jgi:hypothetical protein
MLDKVAVELGPWSGYHVLAQHCVLWLLVHFAPGLWQLYLLTLALLPFV